MNPFVTHALKLPDATQCSAMLCIHAVRSHGRMGATAPKIYVLQHLARMVGSNINLGIHLLMATKKLALSELLSRLD